MMIALLGMAVGLMASEFTDSPGWHDDYAVAISEVHRTDKPLFIVFDAGSDATWRVHETTYMSAQVEATLAADYVRLFVDVETESGRELAEQFGVDETPRVVIIDRSGEWQVYRRAGRRPASEIASALSQFRRSKITSPSQTVPTASRTTPTTTSPVVMPCRT